MRISCHLITIVACAWLLALFIFPFSLNIWQSDGSTILVNTDSKNLADEEGVTVANHTLAATSLPEPPANEFHNLRFLFMGTSRTYGSHLQKRLQRTFSYRISPQNSTNIAVPGSSPPFPSMCLFSMVQPVEHKDAFDVIVLEYEGGFMSHTLRIVKRLRKRFPMAEIILTDMWLMKRFIHVPSGKEMGSFVNNHIQLKEHVEMDHAVARVVQEKSNATDWKYTGEVYKPKDMQMFANVGATVLRAPVPKDGYEAARQGYKYFLTDFHHFGPGGHAYIASLILQHLREVQFRTHHNASLGEWDERDQCASWYMTPNEVKKIERDPRWVFRNFTSEKFALEARRKDHWIKIVNPDSEAWHFSFLRMVAMPDCQYPDTEISISNDTSVLSTCPATSQYTWQVNVAKLMYVGQVPPGPSTIRFNVLEEGKPWPFRIAGYALTKSKALV